MNTAKGLIALLVLVTTPALAADKPKPATQPAQVFALIDKADLPAPAAKGEPMEWPKDKAALATKTLVKELKGKTRSFRLPVTGPINRGGHWGTTSQPVRITFGEIVLAFTVDYEFPELSPALKELNKGQIVTIEGTVSLVRAGRVFVGNNANGAPGVYLELNDCRIIAK